MGFFRKLKQVKDDLQEQVEEQVYKAKQRIGYEAPGNQTYHHDDQSDTRAQPMYDAVFNNCTVHFTPLNQTNTDTRQANNIAQTNSRTKEMEPQPDCANIFRAGLSAGFDVMDAYQSYNDGDGLQPRLEQTLRTPWTYHGMLVLGYTNTDVRENARNGAHHFYTTDVSEFWLRQPDGQLLNLDDVRGSGAPGFLTDANGNQIPLDQAHLKLREFASAAAEYPHVFLCDEWMEVRSYVNGRFGMAPPTTRDYTEQYLPTIEQQLANPSHLFVGRIRQKSDIHIAYESAAGYDNQ